LTGRSAAWAAATAAKAAADPRRELFKSFIDISKSFEIHKIDSRPLARHAAVFIDLR
jgi:hypothetical protein